MANFGRLVRSSPFIYSKSFENKPTEAISNWFQLSYDGGDRGARTPDLRIANATLSQLSYIPKNKIHYNIAFYNIPKLS